MTFDDYFNESIVSDTKKEGSGALYINNTGNTTGDVEIVFNAINETPSGKKVLGFWFRVKYRNDSTWFQLKWEDPSTGSYMYFGITDNVYNKFHGASNSGPINLMTFELNTWYWIELVWVNKDYQTIRINGDTKHVWQNENVQFENANLKAHVYTGFNAGRIYIDGIRIASNEQYPPPDDYAPAPCSISSSSDSLILNARVIDIHIKKSFSPAIYKVVQRDRNVLDSEIYIKNLLALEFISRLSSSEVETLRTIFNDGEATIKLGGWTFNGWFGKKKIVWDYRKESEERPWKVTFTFDVTNYSYEG